MFLFDFSNWHYILFEPCCLGQEIAKRLLSLQINLPLANAQLSNTHGGDFTLTLFIAEHQAGKL